MLQWKLKTFDQLTTPELFEYLKLRQAVFVVEQTCPYPDIDDTDTLSHHLLGSDAQGLVACARLIPAGVTYEQPSIGRIATHLNQRGSGLGRDLVARCLENMQELHPNQSIKIGAQERLQRFYQSFGFDSVGEPYLEDDILHIHMILKKSN